MKEDKSGWPVILLAFAAIPVGIPLEGWCLAKLWQWFVEPLGVHHIGMWQASGLALIVAYVITRKQSRASRDRSWSEMADLLWTPIVIGAPLTMLCGYIVHRLMVG